MQQQVRAVRLESGERMTMTRVATIMAHSGLAILWGLLCHLASSPRVAQAQGQQAPSQLASGPVTADEQQAFFAALTKSDIPTLTALLDKNPALQDATHGGLAALPQAVSWGKADVVALLLEHGAPVNAMDAGGYTPLTRALDRGNAVVADLLLSKGADANLTDLSGHTPLYLAVNYTPDKHIIDQLIAKGALVNALDKTGNAPLHYAVQARRQSREIVAMVLAHDANVNLPNAAGMTPLHIAATKAVDEIVALLVARGADVNARDRAGDTPISLAIGAAHPGAVRALLAKADLTVPNHAGLAPLLVAVFQHNGAARDMIRAHQKGEAPADQVFDLASQDDLTGLTTLLEQHPALATLKLPNQATPLHAAALWAARDIASLLLQHGAEINARNDQQETPLHLAIRSESDHAASKDVARMVKRLIDKGADTNATDAAGNTPLHRAVTSENTEVVALLTAAGAKVNVANRLG